MTTANKKANAIVEGLLRIGSYLHRTGDLIASEFELNQQQFVVLNKIAHRKKLIQKDIVSDLVLNKSHVSKILKKLKRLEYITINESAHDKRATVIQITDHGYSIWQACLNKLNAWNHEWVKPLTKKQLEQLEPCILQLTKRLEGW